MPGSQANAGFLTIALNAKPSKVLETSGKNNVSLFIPVNSKESAAVISTHVDAESALYCHS